MFQDTNQNTLIKRNLNDIKYSFRLIKEKIYSKNRYFKYSHHNDTNKKFFRIKNSLKKKQSKTAILSF